MTPEEIGLIEAALNLAFDNPKPGSWPRSSQGGAFGRAVEQFLGACPECRSGRHRCPEDGNAIPHGLLTCEAHNDASVSAEVPRWIPATLGAALANDRIRIGVDECTVTRSTYGVWNVTNEWRPRKWRHAELRMDLTANPGLQQYDPATSCEILMSPERHAIFLLTEAFPGAVVAEQRCSCGVTGGMTHDCETAGRIS